MVSPRKYEFSKYPTSILKYLEIWLMLIILTNLNWLFNDWIFMFVGYFRYGVQRSTSRDLMLPSIGCWTSLVETSYVILFYVKLSIPLKIKEFRNLFFTCNCALLRLHVQALAHTNYVKVYHSLYFWETVSSMHWITQRLPRLWNKGQSKLMEKSELIPHTLLVLWVRT